MNRLGFSARYSAGTAIDLGNDPPLLVDGQEEEAPIRRGVHWRWLAGTIFTGFTSIFLMGGALVAALDNPDLFARAPAAEDIVAGPDQNVEFGKKGDRMRPLETPVASRQILQVSTVTRQGERDFIKLKPFAKITASLITKKELADQVPPYDALRLFADNSPPEGPPPADGAAPAEDQIYGADVDGEVSVKVTDFPVNYGDVDATVGLDTPGVEQLVRAAANFSTGPEQVAALPFIDPTRFTDEGGDDPFSAMGVRIIPENVSNITKSDETTVATGGGDKIVAVTKGQSFRELLRASAIGDDDANEIVAALANLIDLNQIHVGQKLRIAFAADPANPAELRPIRVSVYDDGAHQATIARADNNSFVRADEPSFVEEDFADGGPDATVEEDTGGGMPKVYDAVYETALEQQVPPDLIDQIIRIFAFDVDFQSRVSPGDQMQIFQSLQDPNDKEAGEPEILYASLTLGGVTRTFYRFRTPDDGIVDYYDEDGKSAKKFLMRKPISVGVIRSGFGWRVHPILGYRRLHTGVDYAAPRMTPILAAGNGIVEKAGPSSGYGNFTLIRHTNGYETGYGHQTSFAKGIVPGARVRQGQVIGYVGSTGLSTGPHLHFEIRVNGTPVDPLRIRLPRGRVLEADLLTSFERERARIDALMGTPAPGAKVASAAPVPSN